MCTTWPVVHCSSISKHDLDKPHVYYMTSGAPHVYYMYMTSGAPFFYPKTWLRQTSCVLHGRAPHVYHMYMTSCALFFHLKTWLRQTSCVLHGHVPHVYYMYMTSDALFFYLKAWLRQTSLIQSSKLNKLCQALFAFLVHMHLVPFLCIIFMKRNLEEKWSATYTSAAILTHIHLVSY